MNRREPKGAEGSRTPVTGCQASASTAETEAGDATQEPASQRLASDRRDWGTQKDDPGARHNSRDWETSETRPEPATGRRRETSGRQDTPGASRSIWHLTAKQFGASVTKNGRWKTQGTKRETQPLTQRRSIWHPDTGRQAGDTTEPASQHLKHWETSRRHPDPASPSLCQMLRRWLQGRVSLLSPCPVSADAR